MLRGQLRDADPLSAHWPANGGLPALDGCVTRFVPFHNAERHPGEPSVTRSSSDRVGRDRHQCPQAWPDIGGLRPADPEPANSDTSCKQRRARVVPGPGISATSFPPRLSVPHPGPACHAAPALRRVSVRPIADDPRVLSLRPSAPSPLGTAPSRAGLPDRSAEVAASGGSRGALDRPGAKTTTTRPTCDNSPRLQHPPRGRGDNPPRRRRGDPAAVGFDRATEVPGYCRVENPTSYPDRPERGAADSSPSSPAIALRE